MRIIPEDIERFSNLPDRLRSVSLISDRSELFDLIGQLEDFREMYEDNRNKKGENHKPAPYGYIGRIESMISILWNKYRPEISSPTNTNYEQMAMDVEFILKRIKYWYVRK